MSLLSLSPTPTKDLIEQAASRFLDLGAGEGKGHVIIRSGAMGAYVVARSRPGKWIDAFWTSGSKQKVVDVTGQYYFGIGRLTAESHWYRCR